MEKWLKLNHYHQLIKLNSIYRFRLESDCERIICEGFFEDGKKETLFIDENMYHFYDDDLNSILEIFVLKCYNCDSQLIDVEELFNKSMCDVARVKR